MTSPTEMHASVHELSQFIDSDVLQTLPEDVAINLQLKMTDVWNAVSALTSKE